MKHLLLISVLFLACSVFAAAPELNITKVGGSPDTLIEDIFSDEADGELAITFNLYDPDSNSVFIDMEYSTSNVPGSGTLVWDDVDSTTLDCGADISTVPVECNLAFDISTIADGNYYVIMSATDGVEGDYDATEDNFMIDNTKPVTTDDYSGEWSGVDVTVTLNCTDLISGCDYTIYKLDSGAEQTYTAPILVSGNGTHELIYLSTDKAGNEEVGITKNVYIDTAGPAFDGKSPANGSYTTDTTPLIEFNVTDTAGFGPVFDGSDLTLTVDGNPIPFASLTATPITGGYNVKYEMGTTNDKTVQVSASATDKLGHNTLDSWSFTIDTQKPTSVSISTSYDSGYTYTKSSSPTFSISASDSGSGLGSGAKMKFSCNNSSWTSEIDYATSTSSFNITSSSYGCNGDNGTKTVYIKVSDVLGNWSDSASCEVKYDSSSPSVPNQNNPAIEDGEIEVRWDNVSDSPAGIKEYVVYVYRDGSLQNTYNTGSTNNYYTVTGLTNDTTYEFKVKARDNASNESDFSDTESATPVDSDSSSDDEDEDADTTDPTLSWENPKNSNEISGTVTLKVRAYDDDTGMRNVRFYFNGTFLATINDSSGDYWEYDFDTTTVEDGTYSIRANAADYAGNTRINDIVVTVSNNEPAEVVTLENEVAETEDSGKDAANEIMLAFEENGIQIPKDLNQLWANANEKLKRADYFSSKGMNEDANAYMDEAKGIFSSIVEQYDVSTYRLADYEFDNGNLTAFFESAVNNSEKRAEAAEINGKVDVVRRIKVLAVKENGTVRYYATIAIYLTNNGSSGKGLNIVEIIPKDFATTASEIVSNAEFEVIKDDPIIMFKGVDIAAGETATMTYRLAEPITAEEADKLIENKVVQQFEGLPILFSSGTEVNANDFTPAESGFAPITMLAGLADFAGNQYVLLGFGVLLLLIAIVFLMGKTSSRSDRGLGTFGSRTRRSSGFNSLDDFDSGPGLEVFERDYSYNPRDPGLASVNSKINGMQTSRFLGDIAKQLRGEKKSPSKKKKRWASN